MRTIFIPLIINSNTSHMPIDWSNPVNIIFGSIVILLFVSIIILLIWLLIITFRD